MDTVTYDIPVAQLDAYRGHRVIVRSRTPSEFQEHLSEQDLKTVSYLRLLSPEADMTPLMRWGNGLPLDIVMADPATAFPLLYQLAPLLDKHPVRISLPVVPGFGKAVKLAASLHFVVNLMVGQPDPEVHDEMVRGPDAVSS